MSFNDIDNKYFTSEEFIKYCKSNKVETFQRELEIYEEKEFLCPIYRLVEPEEFVREGIDTIHNSQAIIPNLEQLSELLKTLRLYRAPVDSYFIEAIDKGHPLDVAYANHNTFLSKPNKSSFKPWKNYKIMVTYTNGTEIEKDTATHYYAPWQIFVIDAINYRYTALVNEITNWKSGHLNLNPSELNEYTELFQGICNVIMKDSLISLDLSLRSRTYIIEGDLFRELTNKTNTIKKNEYEKHSHEEWIKFIRKLVELYKVYLEREKIKLADEMKIFLRVTMETIMNGNQKLFEEVCDEYDGQYKGKMGVGLDNGIPIYSGELQRIFPDERKEAKEHLSWLLPPNIERFNKILPANEQILAEMSNKLIDALVMSGQDVVLSHLHKIEDLWSNRELYWEISLWAHIRSLVISIDYLSGEWFGGVYFGGALIKSFGSAYKQLEQSINSNMQNITSASTPSEYKLKLEAIIAHRKINPRGICGHHLLIAHLTRNYLSHNIGSESGIPGSLFLEIYQGLIFTLISLFVKKQLP